MANFASLLKQLHFKGVYIIYTFLIIYPPKNNPLYIINEYIDLNNISSENIETIRDQENLLIKNPDITIPSIVEATIKLIKLLVLKE